MITKRRILLLTSILALVPLRSLAEPQTPRTSTDTVPLGQGFSAGSVDFMAALANGTRFVLGNAGYNDGSNPIVYLLKVDPGGTRAWMTIAADPAVTFINGLAADADGSAYVASMDFTDFSQPRARVVKYDAAGVLAASADLTTNAPGGDGFPLPAGVGVDSARGRVYVAYAFFSAAQGQHTFAVAAFDTNLHMIGSPRVFNPGYTGADWRGPNPLGGLFTDGQGDVWVGGSQLPPGADKIQTFVAHYTPGLTSVNFVAHDGGNSEDFGGAAVDPRGGMVINGDHLPPVPDTPRQYVLHRVTDGGFGPAFRFEGFDSAPYAPMAVDPTGNLYLLGGDPDTGVNAVIKIGTDNVLAWDQPSAYLDLPEGNPHVLAAASSTTFEVAGVNSATDSSDDSFVFINHYSASSTGTVPLALVAESPASQDATVTKTLAAPLKVKVTEGGNPRQGVMVRWEFISLPSGTTGQDLLEAPGFPSTVVASRDVPTDANGESAVQVKLGDMTGEYLAAANVAGAVPSSIAFTVRGKLFMDIRLSTTSIKPVPFSQIVNADNQLTVMVHAFGVGGSTDVVADYPVAVFSAPISNSGGHDHATNRSGGTFSGIGLTVSTSSATGRTDTGGDLFVVFTSTFFSGTNEFLADSTLDVNTATVTARASIRAGDFDLLPDATYYIKDGGTCEHHGPDGPAGCISPDRNHYGLPNTNATIAAIATRWLAVAGAGRMLEINDMSLPLGGGFDVGGNWTSNIVDLFPADKNRCSTVGHCGHRDGREADIQVSPNLSPGSLPQKQQQKLRDIILNRNGKIHPEGSHWHVRL